MMIADYGQRPINAAQLGQVFERSGIKRPSENIERLGRMIEHADILLGAWDGERLVGVARALTDYSYCCYLSDLAVDRDYQRAGIGKSLVDEVRSRIGSECSLLLISAPSAMEYYPRLGFQRNDKAYLIPRER